MNNKQFDAILIELEIIANESTAEKRKVGAYISDNFNLNTSYRGFNQSLLGYGNKCENTNNETFTHVNHAEEMAIFEYLKSGNIFDEPKLFCSYSPCINCCRLIVQSGIKEVYFVDEHSKNFRNPESGISQDISAMELLKRNNIKVFKANRTNKTFDRIYNNETNKTLFVYHSADADGLLCKKLFEMYAMSNNIDFDIVGWNYDMEAPFLTDKSGVYSEYVFGDICPPVNFVSDNLDKKITILDHHLDAMNDISKLIGDIKNHNVSIKYPDNKYQSGAKLVFVYVCKKNKNTNFLNGDKFFNVLSLVNIVSDYDTWYFDVPDYYVQQVTEQKRCEKFTVEETLTFNKLTKILDNTGFDELCDSIINSKTTIKDLITLNKCLLKAEYQNNKILLDKAGKTSYNNTNIFLVQGYPNYFMMEQIIEQFELTKDSEILLVCFNFNLEKYKITFAVRSLNMTENSNLSALNVAKYFKGGGHLNAAGFSLDMMAGADFIYRYRGYFMELHDFYNNKK